MAGCAGDPEAPMVTVEDFDLDRYLGQWHQVAAIPAWFQSDCRSDTRADYSRAEDGLLAVVNSCTTAEGDRQDAEARARFLGSVRQGRLEVTFVEAFGLWLWPAAGDYWIIGLDPDYHWAVVGEPSREFAWLLARSTELDFPTLRQADEILRRAGYDSCALRLTTPSRAGPLCTAMEAP